jgi:hypothetical protein
MKNSAILVSWEGLVENKTKYFPLFDKKNSMHIAIIRGLNYLQSIILFFPFFLPLF